MNDPGPSGWRRFPADNRSRAWAAAARAAGCALMDDPANAHWWRHGGTWFAGVNLLPNGPEGALAGVPLAGPAIDWLDWAGGWDAAQVSVVRPGYPRQDPGESDAAHRFRRNRDAAHVDGLLPVGSRRRRMVRETHGFILGIGLSAAGAGAAPLVVWEGSQVPVARAFRAALSKCAPDNWPDQDLTDVYQGARRAVFETCRRVEVPLGPGEAVVVHRLAVHGIAPWVPGATSDPDGRMIAYFRPAVALDAWLNRP